MELRSQRSLSNKNRKGLSQMKDAPIEDRRQGNGNDEHKLPESINKSAKKSDHFTTKTSQHIVKHGKRKANTSIGDPAAKISRGKQNSKYTESTRGKGRSINTSIATNRYKNLTTTTDPEDHVSRLSSKVNKPMTGRTMKRRIPTVAKDRLSQ